MMTVGQVFMAFFILCGAGLIAAVIAPARWNPLVLAAIGSVAALVVLIASAVLLLDEATFYFELWPLLSLGTLTIGADRLSALFLFVTGLVFLPVSMFSGVYLVKYAARYSLRYFG